MKSLYSDNHEMSVFELKNKYLKTESKLSKEIRILSEVEKVWIKYDLDDNNTLDFDEIAMYLR